MITITGYSDDIVDVEGDISEEIYGLEDGGFLAFSDGTLIQVDYDKNGVWQFYVMAKGNLYDNKVEGSVLMETNDTVTFKSGILWIVSGKELYHGRKP